MDQLTRFLDIVSMVIGIPCMGFMGMYLIACIIKGKDPLQMNNLGWGMLMGAVLSFCWWMV